MNLKGIIYILLTTVLAGCISNDVPYPVIPGNVVKFEVSGQEKCVVNSKTRTIEIILSDTVDISNVRVVNFEITEQATTTLNPEVALDLSKKYNFTISTYQTYEWSIIATQVINRTFRIEDQVGESVINEKDRVVVAYVPLGYDLSKIKILELKLANSVAEYTPAPTSLRNFTRGQTVLVSCFGRTETWSLYVFNKESDGGGGSDVITTSVNAWAKFAILNGTIPTGVTGAPAFEYKEVKNTNWIKVDAEATGNTFTTKLKGLKSSTSYAIRGVVGDVVGAETTFVTEATEQIPYMNFDVWHNEGKVPYPGPEGIRYWDSGNKGGASFNFIPTTEEKTEVVSGSAVKLASMWAVVKFAAGNIYTGSFVKLDGTNAELDFGIPYTHRPTSLTGWYKYTSGEIDRAKAPYEALAGTMDSCHIYVILCDWTEPFRVVTKTNTLVDLSTANSSIIAMGELKGNRTMSEYENFKIDIHYRDITRKPKYVLIVATASKYGDYFTGSTSSVLLIDEFEFGFE